MKVLFDTNVVLDVLLGRAPHAAVAARLLDLVDRGHLQGAVCATTVTTIHYLAAKAVGRTRAARLVRDLLALFEVVPVDRGVLAQALEAGFDDYEDAVLHEAARVAGTAAIVTRNRKDFAAATVPTCTPNELLSGVRGEQS